MLAHVVVSKYADHCPLHRLHRIYERSGVTIPVSTMSDWTGEVGVRIEPLADRLAERVRQAYVIRTDATGLKVQIVEDPLSCVARGTSVYLENLELWKDTLDHSERGWE